MVYEDLEVDCKEGLALPHCFKRELDNSDEDPREYENKYYYDGYIGTFIRTLAALVKRVASVACIARSTESSEVASATGTRRIEGVIILGSSTGS